MVGTWGIWNVCSFNVAWRDCSCHMSSWLCIWQVSQVSFYNLVYDSIIVDTIYKVLHHEWNCPVVNIIFVLIFVLAHFSQYSRPANVPEGAHIQWEIELLGFEMPKVIFLRIYKIRWTYLCTRNLFIFKVCILSMSLWRLKIFYFCNSL